MADTGFRPPPRRKNALDNRKLSMSAPNGKGKRAGLNWLLVNNNPRIVVYTNDPEDTTNYGKIQAALDAPTFFALMILIERAVAHEGEVEFEPVKLDNMNFTFPGGKRSETPSVESNIIVGKTDEGVIYISVIAARRPAIKFPFLNPDFHMFFHKSGSQFTKAEYSKIYAQSYVDILRLLMAQLLVVEYKEPPPKDDTKKPGGSWGGGGGGAGGGAPAGGGRAAGSSDEFGGDGDIPW